MLSAMSQQHLDAVTRETIWNAHGQRCFYCGHPVLFADVEIDHFIPESISKRDLDGLIERGVLPPTFNVLGEENLVPACPRDNCRKRDLQFTDRFVALQVAAIESAANKVRRELTRKRKLYRLDQIFRHLQKGVDQGSFSPEEALDYMRKLRHAPPAAEFLGVGVPPRAPQILFTDQAFEALRSNGLPPGKLALALERSARSRALRVRKTGDGAPAYVVRLDDARRLIYRHYGDYIVVEGFEHRRG